MVLLYISRYSKTKNINLININYILDWHLIYRFYFHFKNKNKIKRESKKLIQYMN